MTAQAELQELLDVCVPCRAACPIRTDVPGYIEALVKGDAERAYEINRRDNVFPAVLGRVCHRPCEPACRHGRPGKGAPVQICFLKRAAADRATRRTSPRPLPVCGRRACIIGSGPAGLTVANDLALAGWAVTVLEQFEEPGGMLRYGIPEFRLPRDVVAADVGAILDLGITLKTGERIGSASRLAALKADYDAVVVAGGCMQAATLADEADRFAGATPGLDYMRNANLGKLGRSPGRVVVVGGGFTAVDCARTALRHGATEVTLVYRRTHREMRVGPNELVMLTEEGVKQHFLSAPSHILKTGTKVTGVAFTRVTLDATGAIQKGDGTGFELEADQVILAIGQDAEVLDGMSSAGSQPMADGLYFTGDFRDGSGTVIEACAAGRQTAREILLKFDSPTMAPRITVTAVPLDSWTRTVADTSIPLQDMRKANREARMRQAQEVDLGLDAGQAAREAARCYLCNYVFKIDVEACIFCMKCVDVMPVNCISLTRGAVGRANGQIQFTPTENYNRADGIVIDHDVCVRCGECARVCPVDCISIERLSIEHSEINVKEIRA